MGKKSLLFTGLALLGCIACSDETVVTEKPQSPLISPVLAQVSAAAGSYRFEMSETLAELSVTSDQTWCVPTIEGGGILATFPQNDRNETRTAVLTLRQQGTTLATVALVQTRATISLAAPDRNIALKAASESVTVGVTCDVEWTADTRADWLELTPGEGLLRITPTQNPTGAVRKARITLSVGAISDTFSVEQEGAILSIESPSIDLYAVANNRTFDVASNVRWEVTSNASWLTAANREGKLSLTPEANDGDTRTTEIILKAGDIRKAIKITQKSVYESLLGTWTVSGQAYVVKDGEASMVNKSFVGTLLENERNESFLLNGLGTDYLATTTEAPVTLDFDAVQRTASITMGEEIGTFEFMNFTQDPENKATIKSVFLQKKTENGQTQVAYSIAGGEVLTANVSADLNEITFELDKGIGLGMWVHSTGVWSGFFCSYRLIDLTLTREIALESPVAGATANRFFYVGR